MSVSVPPLHLPLPLPLLLHELLLRSTQPLLPFFGRTVLGPGRAPSFPGVLGGYFLGLEPLGDGEGPLVVLLIDVDIVEGILEQAYFLPLVFKEGDLSLADLVIHGRLLEMVGLNEDQKSVLQLLDEVPEPPVLFLQLPVQNLVFKLAVRYISPLDLLSHFLLPAVGTCMVISVLGGVLDRGWVT